MGKYAIAIIGLILAGVFSAGAKARVDAGSPLAAVERDGAVQSTVRHYQRSGYRLLEVTPAPYTYQSTPEGAHDWGAVTYVLTNPDSMGSLAHVTVKVRAEQHRRFVTTGFTVREEVLD